MGNGCSNAMECTSQTKESGHISLIESSRPNLDNLDIIDFEQRVKMFAHPANAGKISFRQLQEGCSPIFRGLTMPDSVTYKLFASPFFQELKFTHN